MSINQKTRLLALFIIIISAFLVYKVALKEKTSIPLKAIEGLEAPDLILNDIEGNDLSPKHLKGRPVFVNFWATWCTQCIEEMPSLQRLYDSVKDEDKVSFFIVIYNDSKENAIAFMKEHKYNLPIFLDVNGSTANSYGLTGVPETYLIDRNGILFKKIIGPLNWDSKEALDLIESLTTS